MAAHQAPPSLGFSRQEHWSGLPFPSPKHESEKWKWSRSVVSNSQRPHRLQPTRLLRPWDFPGKSTGVGCHCLLCFAYNLSLNQGFLTVFRSKVKPMNSLPYLNAKNKHFRITQETILKCNYKIFPNKWMILFIHFINTEIRQCISNTGKLHVLF